MDAWAHGDPYERYMGRWSRAVARPCLAWLGAPPHGRWLDVGCGTGALSAVILERAAPAEVVGIDPSAGFIATARAQTPDPRARFIVGDARALPDAVGTCDVAVSGLALNFVPEPATAMAELVRVLRPGGTLGIYLWDYAGQMALLRAFWDAAAALDPAAREMDEGPRFAAICHPEALAALCRRAGLRDVATRAIDVPTHFRDFDDYWQPFLGGQGPAPAYVATLDAEHQAALRERLRGNLPIAADGSIPLTARAWAVRGRRPAAAA
jgi:SAM-dependent methyltransferase